MCENIVLPTKSQTGRNPRCNGNIPRPQLYYNRNLLFDLFDHGIDYCSQSRNFDGAWPLQEKIRTCLNTRETSGDLRKSIYVTQLKAKSVSKMWILSVNLSLCRNLKSPYLILARNLAISSRSCSNFLLAISVLIYEFSKSSLNW